MSYIAEIIKRECPECQGDKVAGILARNGIINYTLNYHYEIYLYFLSRLDFHKQEERPLTYASKDVLDKYKISRYKLIRIRKFF